MFWLHIRIPGNSVTWANVPPNTPSLLREPGKEEERRDSCSQQRLAREHRRLLPSAPTRRLLSRSRMRKSHVQVRTGPSLCLAESGWRSTWKDREGDRFQMFGNTEHKRCNFSLGRKNSKKPVSECSRARVSKLQPRTRPNLVFCLSM